MQLKTLFSFQSSYFLIKIGTLRGRVLSVGGLKEKLLAAQQHNLTTVIVPKENRDDIEEITKDTPLNLKIVYADNIDDVLVTALQRNPFEKVKEAKNNGKNAKNSEKRSCCYKSFESKIER